MYRLLPSFPTRLKQTNETVDHDCWKFLGEHVHLQSNNETFFGQRQLTFSLSAKCDGVCQKCVCVLCTLELSPVASHWFRVHDPGQDKNRIANLPTGSSSSRVADRIVVSLWTRNRWLATGLSSSVHNTQYTHTHAHTHTHTHTHTFGTHHRTLHLEKMYLVVSVQRMFHCLTEDGHVRPKSFNNQPFRESALDELEKREGAGTLFVQQIITRSFTFFVFPFASSPKKNSMKSARKVSQWPTKLRVLDNGE